MSRKLFKAALAFLFLIGFLPNATAADIAELAKRARNQVKEVFGITLEAEVNLVGVEI